MLVQAESSFQLPTLRWKRAARAAAGLSLVSLLSCGGLLIVDAFYPGSLLLLSAQFLAVLSLATGLMALVIASAYLWLSRPAFRVPFLFIVVLTAAVFSAHLYVINSPPSSTQYSVTDSAGQTSHDDRITVGVSNTSSNLKVTVQASGSDAVAQVEISAAGTAFPPSSYSEQAAWATPLQPGHTLTATLAGVLLASQVTVTYQDLTCYSTSAHVYGCVMDEVYYVPSAQGILAGEHCAPYADNCNLEHPFLVKGFIAAGMAIFGEYNDFGWRIFNVVMGTLAIPLLFVLVLLLSRNVKLGYFASLLLASDTMFFVHSSTALIDVPAIFFSLLAFVFYFWKTKVWKLDNKVVSGIFLGLALLCKETAAFAVLALLCYHFYEDRSSIKGTLAGALKMAIPAAAVFVLGLQAYASIFTSAAVPTFYQEIQFIFRYGGGLTGPGWTDSAIGGYITPLNWLLYYTPVSYLVTHVTTTVNGSGGSVITSWVGVGFYGVANPIVVWLVFAWVPLVLVRAFRRRPAGVERDPDDRAGVFMLFWFFWTYFPFVLLWMEGRVTYPFYMVSIVPALAGGAAYFVTREWFPSKAAMLYLLGAFGWFFLYFPVKDFLPVWVRAFLDR